MYDSMLLFSRDGGLKREKPKDSLKKIQQDMFYSRQLKSE